MRCVLMTSKGCDTTDASAPASMPLTRLMDSALLMPAAGPLACRHDFSHALLHRCNTIWTWHNL
jgi:hypothetical protein